MKDLEKETIEIIENALSDLDNVSANIIDEFKMFISERCNSFDDKMEVYNAVHRLRSKLKFSLIFADQDKKEIKFKIKILDLYYDTCRHGLMI